MFIAAILLGVFSAVFFSLVPMSTSAKSCSISKCFSGFHALIVLASVSYFGRDLYSDQVTTFINGFLYLSGALLLRHGFILRKHSQVSVFSILRSRFYWLCIGLMLAINVFLLHMVYDSFWLRITVMNMLMVIITFSIVPYIYLEKIPTTGEKVVKVVTFLIAGLFLVTPLAYVFTENIRFYILITMLLQLLITHIWFGCLCALMMSDSIQMHYKNSILDSLTGTYNRRYFMNYAQSLPENSYTDTNALIICDLDDFKHINDTYGHQQGDRMIIAFAKLLQDNISRNDMVARIGGEEFAVFLANVTLDEAKKIAQRICDLTKEITIDTAEKAHRLTASFGVTYYGKNLGIDVAFSHADQAMYTAKKQGKSQVFVHTPSFG